MLVIACVLLCQLASSSTVAVQVAPAGEFGGGTASSAWTAEAAQAVARSEYEFRAQAGEPGAWSAPNRSHELRSRVSPVGIEVFPRATSADGACAEWKLALRTASFGRLGELRELSAPSIAAHGARIELDHGALVEWFVNDERGIEQGWTIAERPRGMDPVWIGLEITGDLSLRIDDGARSGLLVDARGEAQMRYTGLLVYDATGRELEARLSPSSAGGFGIRIDDTAATYPVTVDPLLTGPAWTAESNQAGAFFGSTVAAAGDVNGDGFSDVIVGAYSYDNGQADEGRAFVYLGSSSGLAASAAWTAESDQAGAGFGLSVGTAGDVNGDGFSDVIVGAFGYDNGQTDEGRAFVYLGSASGLAASAAWTAESDQVSAQFGAPIGTAGDVNGDGYSDVLVSASTYDNGQTDEGRAYVYLGSASGLAASASWTAESNQAGALYSAGAGASGDVNGDGFGDVIVGAYRYDNGQSDEGRAFVYLGSASGLAASAAWTAESDQVGAQLGSNVRAAGDVNGDGYADVIVGALDFDNGQTDEGRALVYLGSAAGLATSAAWTAESNQAGARFGQSVSTAGDVNGDGFSDVIVGAHMYDNGQTDEGRAFVYLGSATGLATTAVWTADSNQAFANFGSWTGTAGDVNGDGYSDVIVGAPLFDNNEFDEGRAYVYLGSSSGLASTHAWVIESNQADARLGYSVASAGDVNGDGFSDVIVGAPRYDNDQPGEGRAFVYLGAESGLTTTAAWTVESNEVNSFFGGSVASAGDVNGDGYGDVIVGASTYHGASLYEGRVFVYLGSADGLASTAAWMFGSNQAFAGLGEKASGAGDVNGDGFSDVIVAASGYDNGQVDQGRAYVFHGSVTGLSASPTWTAESNQAGAYFGASLGTAGDVNGDGYGDAIIGSYQYDNDQIDDGRALLYLGSATGLAASASWTAQGDQDEESFGSTVASAGDVNGDGFSDVIVAASGYYNPLTSAGRVALYLGAASGLASSPVWTAEGERAVASFGVALAPAGDVNGDGYSDVVITDHYLDETFYAGRASVYLGNQGRGSWTLSAQQRQSGDGAPIALLGRSISAAEFRIQLRFERELAGFGWGSGLAPVARLEWEVAPLSDPLDGSALASGASQALDGSPLVFNELAQFPVLSAGPLQSVAQGAFHWRARLRTNNPVFPVTPWVTMPGNCMSETKLRTGKVPGKRLLQ
ncbi:MAG: integrin alpha [Planctomycetota bacterium]